MPGCSASTARKSAAGTTRHVTGSRATTVATRSVGSVVERGQLADEVTGPPQAEHRLGPGGGGRGDLDAAGRDAAGRTRRCRRRRTSTRPCGSAGAVPVRRPARRGRREPADRGTRLASTCLPARRQCARSRSLVAGVLPARPPSAGHAGVGARAPRPTAADHSGRRPVAELAVGEHDAGDRRRRGRPTGTCREPPKCPNVRGDPSGAVQWGDLAPLQLEAQPPRVGVVAAEAGHDAGEPRELLGGRLGQGRRARPACGASSSRREGGQVVDGRPGVLGHRAAELGVAEARAAASTASAR